MFCFHFALALVGVENLDKISELEVKHVFQNNTENECAALRVE